MTFVVVLTFSFILDVQNAGVDPQKKPLMFSTVLSEEGAAKGCLPAEEEADPLTLAVATHIQT